MCESLHYTDSCACVKTTTFPSIYSGHSRNRQADTIKRAASSEYACMDGVQGGSTGPQMYRSFAVNHV